MTAPLFRPEVLEARRRSRLGGISLAQPLSFGLLTVFTVLAAATVVLFLIFGEYTRRSRVAGQLVPDLGLATVVAPVDGVVRRPMPREGERVRRGRRLAVIATPWTTAEAGDVTAGLLLGLQSERSGLERGFASRDALLELQRSGYRRQRNAARRELEQIGAGLAIRQRQQALAAEVLGRYRELSRDGYVSRLTLAREEQAALELTAGIRTLERQATAVRRDILQIEQALRELPAERSAQAAAKVRELAALERERLHVEADGEILVEAPVSGLVATRLIERGQTVRAGQPLLSILPADSVLEAHLRVPSRAIGFIEPGDTVVLRYPAFPHEKFGHHLGTVLRISRNALSRQGVDTGTGMVGPAGAEPYYRVVVTLPAQWITAFGKREMLRPGMRVDADLLGERRTLFEWLLEPLYSLSGSL